jgi:hypothetical protein
LTQRKIGISAQRVGRNLKQPDMPTDTHQQRETEGCNQFVFKKLIPESS